MTTAPTAASPAPTSRPISSPTIPTSGASRRRSAGRIAASVALLGIAAACGGASGVQTASSQTTTVSPSFTVTATDNKFDGTSYKATPTFALEYRNRGSVTHSLVVKDATGKTVTNRILLAPGKVAGFQATGLAAGAYKLVCDVPGHEGTMKADLTIG